MKNGGNLCSQSMFTFLMLWADWELNMLFQEVNSGLKGRQGIAQNRQLFRGSQSTDNGGLTIMPDSRLIIDDINM